MNIDPWKVIGWMVLIPLALVILLFSYHLIRALLRAAVNRVRIWRLHLKTRNTPPAADQRWAYGDVSGTVLTITRVTEDGKVCLNTPTTFWVDSAEDWKTRVRGRRMYLVSRG